MAAMFDVEGDLGDKLVDEQWAWLDAGRDVADDCFGLVVAELRGLDERAALRRLKRYRLRLSALECEVLASRVAADGNTRGAESLLGDGKTSRAEQRRKARRAKAVAKNAKLAAKMAAGEMSEEQVDVIAGASDKTKGEAVVDDVLIDKVASVDPDQGKAIVDQYIADRATSGGTQSEHDRQRALRRASKYHSRKSGCDVISLEGDSVAVKNMWTAIRERANQLYKADGGRDLALSQHPRTNDQRAFDAAHQLICGLNPKAAAAGTSTLTGTTGAGEAARPVDQAAAAPIQSKRYTPLQNWPKIVITMTVDKLVGRDPAAVAVQNGLGVIADSVLSDYANNADILTALFDRNGEQLWFGRLHRYANQTQLIALIIRDKRCVQCGADHTECEAHHRMPWNAPGQGRTDLDQLVLLCGPCHRRLHHNNRTIYQDPQGHWRTRPATPHETPPNRPKNTRNTPQRE